MKKYWGVIFLIVTTIVFVGITLFRNKTEFPTLFAEYEYTSCITTGKHSGSNGLSLVIDYTYKADGKVYKGGYATTNGTKIQTPNGRYLVVYSKNDPAYHIFFETEVINDKLDGFYIDKEELRKRFDVNNKARRIKGKYSNDEDKVPIVY